MPKLLFCLTTTPVPCNVFLAHFQPQLGLLMETELWPNLIHVCANAGVPLLLANARLSEKSLNGYLRVNGLISPAVARLAGVLAQSPADADRLRQLGAQAVEVVGNIKFDNLPPAPLIERGQGWKTALARRKLLLFASSREGEEIVLLEALKRAGWADDLLLLLVPRHPPRFDEVAALLAQRICRPYAAARNGDALEPQVRVLLGDSIGRDDRVVCLGRCGDHGRLDFAVQQNLIEACAVGAPVLLGPSVFNFAQAHRWRWRAARSGPMPDALAHVAVQLLDDAAARTKVMGQAGREVRCEASRCHAAFARLSVRSRTSFSCKHC